MSHYHLILIPAITLSIGSLAASDALPQRQLVDRVIPAYGTAHERPYFVTSSLDTVYHTIVSETSRLSAEVMAGKPAPATTAAPVSNSDKAAGTPTPAAQIQQLLTRLQQAEAGLTQPNYLERWQINAAYANIQQAAEQLHSAGWINAEAYAQLHVGGGPAPHYETVVPAAHEAPATPVAEPVAEPSAPVAEPTAPIAEPAAPVAEPVVPVTEPAVVTEPSALVSKPDAAPTETPVVEQPAVVPATEAAPSPPVPEPVTALPPIETITEPATPVTVPESTPTVPPPAVESAPAAEVTPAPEATPVTDPTPATETAPVPVTEPTPPADVAPVPAPAEPAKEDANSTL